MILILLQILTVIFAIFGLAEGLRTLFLWIFSPLPKHRSVRLLCLTADSNENDLLAEAERMRLVRHGNEHRIFAVDCGIPPHKKPLMLYAANQCPEILLCTPQEVLDWINAIGEPYATNSPTRTD